MSASKQVPAQPVVRQFFHSFPRLGKNETAEAHADRACAILEYMKEVGLVLAPELVTWEVPGAAGTQSLPMLQRRACLTELSDRELAPHAAQFGPVTLVFNIERMRRLGAMPVIYAPQLLTPNDLSFLSVFTVNAVHHTDAVLGQLEILRNASDPTRAQQNFGHPLAPNATLDLQNTDAAGNVVARYQIPAGHVDAVMKHVGFNNIPFDHSRAALHVFLNMFYPADNAYVGEQLGYYRQREWRVISSGRLNFNGRPTSRELSSIERTRLLEIDSAFWSRTITIQGQAARRVELAHLYSPLPDFRLLDVVEGIVVAKDLLPRVRAIVGNTVRVEKLGTRGLWSRILDAGAALLA
jgi:hypothetical protein